jgi:hypothetical protein
MEQPTGTKVNPTRPSLGQTYPGSGPAADEAEQGSPMSPAASSKPAETASSGRNRLAANLVSALVVVLATCVPLGYAISTGLSARRALLGLAMIGLTQVLPGALVWRVVRPRDGWLLEDLIAGFAIGTALAVPVQIVAGLTHQRWLATALPLLLAATLVAVPHTRRRVVRARWGPIPWWFAPVVGLVSIAALPQFAYYARNNRVSYPSPMSPHIDTYLHQALASQLLTRGPVSWPTVAGEDLGYHWFTHAWLAQVAASSSLELNDILTRLMPALMPIAVVLAVAMAGLRLGRVAWVGAFAAFVTMLGGRVNPFGVTDPAAPMMPESPTLALGAPILVLLVTLLALRWRGEAAAGAWVLVPLLAVVAAGTKGSTSPLVVAGLGLAAVAMLIWNRKQLRPVLVDLGTVALSLVFAVVVVFHGSSAGLKVGVAGAAEQTLLGRIMDGLPTGALVGLAIAVTVVGGLSRAALAFALPFFRDSRADPLSWLLIGASIAGAAAPAVFSHPGQSQVYFYLTAVPLAALGSALGLARLHRAWGARLVGAVLAVGATAGVALLVAPMALFAPVRAGETDSPWRLSAVALVVLAAAVVVGAVVAVLMAGWRHAVPVAAATLATALLFGGAAGATKAWLALWTAPLPAEPAVTVRNWGAISQGQIDVARYIRDHSAIDDLVMTNRHCVYPRRPFDGCDSRRWLVTAFSERQSLVEGWTATPKATRIAPHGRDSITVNYWKPDVLRLNDGFIAAPTAEAHRRLWELGVRWVYVENTIKHADSLAPYAVERFATGDASAWELLPPR